MASKKELIGRYALIEGQEILATAITTAGRAIFTLAILVVTAAEVAIEPYAQPINQPDRPTASLWVPSALRAAAAGYLKRWVT